MRALRGEVMIGLRLVNQRECWVPDRLSLNIAFNEYLLATGHVPQQGELYIGADDHGSDGLDGQRRIAVRVALSNGDGALRIGPGGVWFGM